MLLLLVNALQHHYSLNFDGALIQVIKAIHL